MADQAGGKLSPYLRRCRIAAALPHLSGRVLDYGCGVGALADIIPPGRYAGVDADNESLDIAKKLHPAHRFYRPNAEELKGNAFDAIALLAVLEHIDDRIDFLRELGVLLAVNGKIVLTTPGPLAGPVHGAGSRVGIFSREAAEEHGKLVGFAEMERLARAAEFRVTLKKRFLLGMNQLFILEKA